MPKIIHSIPGTTLKIFLGFLQKSELKLHLQQSLEWQREKSFGEQVLLEITKEEQQYLGVWLESGISYENLKKTESKVRSQLQLYCPKIKLDTQPIYLFPQIFIN